MSMASYRPLNAAKTMILWALLVLVHVRAQSIPDVLPTNWTSVGCFTDISTSRTLAATSLIQDPMTIEACIHFCQNAGYIYAGVEYSRECYCDSTTQIPSQPVSLSDCSMPCSGNTNETCGGPDVLNVFLDNAIPPPVIVRSVNGTQGGLWTYQGCFTDAVSARTLGNGVNIPTGTTAESCTAACQAAGGFTLAGLENGHECWCDNTTNNTSQHVSDDDCRMVCSATHTEYCGNANRLAIYQFSTSDQAPSPQICLATDVGNFTLMANFQDPLVQGPAAVALRVVVVEMVDNIIWTILSACPLCCSEWPNLSMQNSIISPQSIVIPTQQMTSGPTNDGESPNFVASIPAFPGFQGYCTMSDPTAVAGSPPLLAFNGKADSFSLCTNTSANARVDVVFLPVTGHPHYVLEDCEPVSIQVIT